jgi:hypothetical protein
VNYGRDVCRGAADADKEAMKRGIDWQMWLVCGLSALLGVLGVWLWQGAP